MLVLATYNHTIRISYHKKAQVLRTGCITEYGMTRAFHRLLPAVSLANKGPTTYIGITYMQPCKEKEMRFSDLPVCEMMDDGAICFKRNLKKVSEFAEMQICR